MNCRFCSDGNCLLCQLSTPIEPGVSSSHGRLVSDGNRRVPRTLDHDVRGSRDFIDYGARHYKEGRMCPICKFRYFDLWLHYKQKHPEEPSPKMKT